MKVVFGTDLSPESKAGARWAAAFVEAERKAGKAASLQAAYIVSSEFEELRGDLCLLDDHGNRLRLEREVRDALGDLSEDCAVELREGSPVAELRDISSTSDLFVLGKALDSLARWAQGSVAERLCHRPLVPTVVVHPDHPLGEAPTWVVGIDFGATTTPTVELAVQLARVVGARLHFVHVVPSPSPVALNEGHQFLPLEAESLVIDEAATSANKRMRAFKDSIEQDVKDLLCVWHVQTGYPMLSLIDYARSQNASAIVVGTVGRSPLGDLIMGSVSSGVLKRMPCTVILAPPPDS